ncbi:succinylglutamate desuccinylase/aspartoacylase family protein [Haloarchaeobius sp. HME9146]|uniref:succinylglutamate desuccinylase/aspartoacylase domain-containing protein n=1 Tax=Haloarchaeobius sp. HME9146 TaxID=2978732 RepID=UPI0021C05771|nr:succinylglutamate desuccinylase/aspartoacylase family protein [Haloarchaeobius sp. HME9146]MCT9097302.1 succinylglutamate desuccinylase/aspartoacylase family protein [Haloarchaeobius sp. HME9146]
MKVSVLGEGTPEVAVVAGVHGDEPCGVHAVETLLERDPDVERPVKFVIANEEAVERGVRYVEADLNRSFPGYPDGETHEKRLAYDLAHELTGCRVLALHSTQSHDEPFAVVDGVDDLVRDICPQLPITAIVETGRYVEGRVFNSVPQTIEVECGLQGSEDAKRNAVHLTESFLTATGVLPGTIPPRRVPIYRLTERVPKAAAEEYEVFVPNFHRVESGEAFAAVDGESQVAADDFYPVLLSAYGYEDVFGYSAEKVGMVGQLSSR